MATPKMVKIGKVPGTVSEFMIENGSTVLDLCTQADLNPTGYELRRNGRLAEASEVVQDGDVVMLLKKIKGNA